MVNELRHPSKRCRNIEHWKQLIDLFKHRSINYTLDSSVGDYRFVAKKSIFWVIQSGLYVRLIVSHWVCEYTRFVDRTSFQGIQISPINIKPNVQ